MSCTHSPCDRTYGQSSPCGYGWPWPAGCIQGLLCLVSARPAAMSTAAPLKTSSLPKRHDLHGRVDEYLAHITAPSSQSWCCVRCTGPSCVNLAGASWPSGRYRRPVAMAMTVGTETEHNGASPSLQHRPSGWHMHDLPRARSKHRPACHSHAEAAAAAEAFAQLGCKQ